MLGACGGRCAGALERILDTEERAVAGARYLDDEGMSDTIDRPVVMPFASVSFPDLGFTHFGRVVSVDAEVLSSDLDATFSKKQLHVCPLPFY